MIEVLEEAVNAINYITKEKFSEYDKKQIIKETIENCNEHVNPGWLMYNKLVYADSFSLEPEVFKEIFWGRNGKNFINCFDRFGMYSDDNRNIEIIEAVRAQLNRYTQNNHELIDPLRGYLAKLFSLITPGNLKYSFFCNSEAEAVEIALKLTRLASGNHYYISTVNGFHGESLGAVSATGKGFYRKPYLPTIQGVQHVEYGNANAAEAAINNLISVGETVAAMIVEPIQVEAGIIFPPQNYLKELRYICDRYGVLLIFDEIQTGMGKTGTMWACEAYDVVPDVLAFGKSLGGGIIPITGIIALPHLWTNELKENPLILGSPKIGDNSLAFAAAIATIKYTVDNNLPGQIDKKGKYTMEKLKKLKRRHPMLVDVRGKGLLFGLEFPTAEIRLAVSRGLFKRGIIVGDTLNNSKVIRIELPNNIIMKTIDIIYSKLNETLSEVNINL
ncbi:MAG: aminotransferase class III-fold pyridoxal phosphate-dependent enzyme [Deltaproteobacteria bacterium]|nr:aminotransferase class III-fold pyridoxal phosphate-dependent enzyme [Deltaproteobacteria bacterium]